MIVNDLNSLNTRWADSYQLTWWHPITRMLQTTCRYPIAQAVYSRTERIKLDPRHIELRTLSPESITRQLHSALFDLSFH